MQEAMTSRQRVLTALEHKEADRVPIDFGSMRSSGIASIAYNNLIKELGLPNDPCRMYDFQQQLAYVGKSVRDRFHVDVIDAGQAFLRDEEEWREWPLNDGSSCLIPRYLNADLDNEGNIFLKSDGGLVVGTKPKGSLYTDQAYWPYGDMPAIPAQIDGKELQNHMWAIPCPPFQLDYADNEDDRKVFVKGVKELRKTTDYAIMLVAGFSLFEVGQYARKTTNFLMDLLLDVEGVQRLLDVLVDSYIGKLDRILANLKEDVDIIQFSDDLGTQKGPWMDPGLLEKLFVPRYKKLFNYVHNNSKVKVFLHSCGSIYKLMPLLIDAGVDIINPVQTSAVDMDPVRLKKEFGGDITFWGGGCDTQSILSQGTPEDVKEDVKRRIAILARDGGFVFNQIHNVLANVPPENVIALYDAAFEYGWY